MVVLDSSAALAVILKEPGHERVAAAPGRVAISAVNYSETLQKCIEYGLDINIARDAFDTLAIEVVPFGRSHAEAAAQLREPTRAFGLSLGDRACLALGIERKEPVLTTDRAMARAQTAAEVHLIR